VLGNSFKTGVNHHVSLLLIWSSIMKNWTTAVTQFLNDESGATAIEYGLIAGLISVVIAASVTTIGGDLKTIFTSIATKLTAAIPAS
jgi:pilus assembly protein Flp/PilA